MFTALIIPSSFICGQSKYLENQAFFLFYVFSIYPLHNRLCFYYKLLYIKTDSAFSLYIFYWYKVKYSVFYFSFLLISKMFLSLQLQHFHILLLNILCFYQLNKSEWLPVLVNVRIKNSLSFVYINSQSGFIWHSHISITLGF